MICFNNCVNIFVLQQFYTKLSGINSIYHLRMFVHLLILMTFIEYVLQL